MRHAVRWNETALLGVAFTLIGVALPKMLPPLAVEVLRTWSSVKTRPLGAS